MIELSSVGSLRDDHVDVTVSLVGGGGSASTGLPPTGPLCTDHPTWRTLITLKRSQGQVE